MCSRRARTGSPGSASPSRSASSTAPTGTACWPGGRVGRRVYYEMEFKVGITTHENWGDEVTLGQLRKDAAEDAHLTETNLRSLLMLGRYLAEHPENLPAGYGGMGFNPSFWKGSRQISVKATEPTNLRISEVTDG